MKFLGPIVYSTETRDWRDFLKKDAVISDLAAVHPRLQLKIYRPYLARYLTCSDRVNLLKNHYRIIVSAGLSGLVEKTAIQPHNLCTFTGKNNTQYELEFMGLSYDRDGEVNLRLVSAGRLLYYTSFIFATQGNDIFIKLGCLQGVRSDKGALHVKLMTRDLYGSRPKDFMMSIMRDLGNYFDCKAIIMVGNKNRIVPLRILFWKRIKILADYDQTCEEIGGIKMADGNYELSCVNIFRKNLDDTLSKKRSEVKKRNALLDSIFQSVSNSLNVARSNAQTNTNFAGKTDSKHLTLKNPIRLGEYDMP